MLETILLAGAAGAALPSWFWGATHHNKKRMELSFHIKIAQSLGHAAAIRDHGTGAHNFRVTYMSSIIGETLNLKKKSLQALMKGAFLHDIGKIGIPDKILLKNGPLNDKEWETMKLHTILGKELIEDMPWFNDAMDVIIHHHERFDGTGYPYGLKGENIPLNARIFAIIDVFDALMSTRPYKKAFSYTDSLTIMKNHVNTHFDPKILGKFFIYAPDFSDTISNNSIEDLKLKLIERRKKIFGL